MDDYAEWLFATRSEVEEIVVFGSFAQGNFAPGSDLDVFLVLSRSPARVRDRIPGLMPHTFPVALDLFPFTREEIAARAGSSLMAAVRTSRWRYSRAAA